MTWVEFQVPVFLPDGGAVSLVFCREDVGTIPIGPGCPQRETLSPCPYFCAEGTSCPSLRSGVRVLLRPYVFRVFAGEPRALFWWRPSEFELGRVRTSLSCGGGGGGGGGSRIAFFSTVTKVRIHTEGVREDRIRWGIGSRVLGGWVGGVRIRSWLDK